MLTQLSTIKARLALTVTDYDDLLNSAIKAVSARFDKETNRTLPRSVARNTPTCSCFDRIWPGTCCFQQRVERKTPSHDRGYELGCALSQKGTICY